MNVFSCCFITLVLLCTYNGYTQATLQKQKVIGGSLRDDLVKMRRTADGGLILGGFSDSDSSGDKSENSKGYTDFWVVKMASQGAIQWENTIGGTGVDALEVIEQTTDGGYLAGGTSSSSLTGDKTEPRRGLDDYWLVKLGSNGNVSWDKTIGGNSYDVMTTVLTTPDGGYLLGGYSESGKSGEKTANSRGKTDYWIVKLDQNRNVQWDKTIGGSNIEYLKSIIRTGDGGYLLAGTSYSGISGEKTGDSKGGSDFWIVKLNKQGIIQWDKTIGGDGYELLNVAILTPDGGFLLGGNSSSGISGDKIEANRGYEDMWIVQTDQSGNKLWDKTIGGSSIDYLNDLQISMDGGYIIGGTSVSEISFEKSESTRGEYDYWIVKLDNARNVVWDKTIGGGSGDYMGSLLQLSNNTFLLNGYSQSDISGDKTVRRRGREGFDCWLVQLQYNANASPLASGKVKDAQQQEKMTADFSVYPAPANNILYIHSNGKATFALISLEGKTIQSWTQSGNGNIDITAVPAGIYWLKNTITGTTRKVVVAH